MSLADRATIATWVGIWRDLRLLPVDGETINYLTMSGRDTDRIALVEAYSKAQDMWRVGATVSDLVFTDTLELDLGDVVPSMAGRRSGGRAARNDRAELRCRARKRLQKPGQLSNRLRG